MSVPERAAQGCHSRAGGKVAKFNFCHSRAGGNPVIKIIVALMILLAASLSFASAHFSPPYIQSYHSDIQVQKDSMLKVTDTIKIVTAGQMIRHGIFRDFPTLYYTPQKVTPSYQVLHATMNGRTVPFHTQQDAMFERVFVGSENTILPAGTYTFTLTYTVGGEMSFLPHYDKLYWNVTGNFWAYPIAKASTTIHLPEGTSGGIQNASAFQGQGDQKIRLQALVNKAGNQMTVTSLSVIDPHHRLALELDLKKGIVSPPTLVERWNASIKQMHILYWVLLGLCLVSLYYFVVWYFSRKGLQERAIMPQYEPPKGYSPAILRYIMDVGFDQKVFAAAILSMAVKGYLTVGRDRKRVHQIIKKSGFKGTLTKGEQLIADEIFKKGEVFKPGVQGMTTRNVLKDFNELLAADLKGQYFKSSLNIVIFGNILTFCFLLGSVYLIHSKVFNQGLYLFFACITVHIIAASGRHYTPGFLVNAGKKLKRFLSFLILFAGAAVGLFWSFLDSFGLNYHISGYIGICIGLMGAVNIIGYYMITYRTQDGIDVTAHAKGFKLFLNATQKDRMNFRNPPDRTPELFEKYLPYAIALGVENRWAKNFADVFKAQNYQPGWYTGSAVDAFVLGSFLSSFNSSVSQSMPGGSGSFGGVAGIGGGAGGGGGGW